MGAGIAYSCLGAGYEVHLFDIDAKGLERGNATLGKLFDAGIARGKFTAADAENAMARLASGTEIAAAADADLVIEAVFESLSIKQEVFQKLGEICKADAILATNTSTLDVDAIAAASGRPEQVIGLHFFSPAHIMRLLEIVRGRETSDEVIATSLALAKALGKIGVVVGNCFGFVGNRMLYSYGRENQLLLLEGAAPEYIDRVLYDWGMAMGPNAVGDLAGLDVGYKIRQERRDLPDDPRFYRVANLLAEQGRFGQKTGRGMFLYDSDTRQPKADPDVARMIEEEAARLGIVRRDIGEQEIVERCIYGLISEGARILEDGIATRAGDIDVIWINGYGFPRHRGGPMHFADTIGLDKVYDTVCRFRDTFGVEYWTPPRLLERLARDNGRFADLDT
jgi:3-hydroxyacyl-CoA dehydrogenase